MNGMALAAAFVGAIFGAGLCICVTRRRWWIATGLCAMGSAAFLNIATEGNHSRLEHHAVFAASTIFITFYALCFIADKKLQRRKDQAQVQPTR
jgi:hypothetical protein